MQGQWLSVRVRVHVCGRVKGEPEGSSESHLLVVESYIFIWSAHWFHVTVLPAANTPQTHRLTHICLFFFPFLATCFVVRLFLFLRSSFFFPDLTGFSVLDGFFLQFLSVLK